MKPSAGARIYRARRAQHSSFFINLQVRVKISQNFIRLYFAYPESAFLTWKVPKCCSCSNFDCFPGPGSSCCCLTYCVIYEAIMNFVLAEKIFAEEYLWSLWARSVTTDLLECWIDMLFILRNCRLIFLPTNTLCLFVPGMRKYSDPINHIPSIISVVGNCPDPNKKVC